MKIDRDILPPIVMTEMDHDRLSHVASMVIDKLPDVAELLGQELDRAHIVPAGEIPADVVTMNSTVEFVYGPPEHTERLTLVYPREADTTAGKLSIVSLIGAALIGLKTGDTMRWRTRYDEMRELKLLNVISQPEREGRFNL